MSDGGGNTNTGVASHFMTRLQELAAQGGAVQVDPEFLQMTPRLLSALESKI